MGAVRCTAHGTSGMTLVCEHVGAAVWESMNSTELRPSVVVTTWGEPQVHCEVCRASGEPATDVELEEPVCTECLRAWFERQTAVPLAQAVSAARRR